MAPETSPWSKTNQRGGGRKWTTCAKGRRLSSIITSTIFFPLAPTLTPATSASTQTFTAGSFSHLSLVTLPASDLPPPTPTPAPNPCLHRVVFPSPPTLNLNPNPCLRRMVLSLQTPFPLTPTRSPALRRVVPPLQTPRHRPPPQPQASTPAEQLFSLGHAATGSLSTPAPTLTRVSAARSCRSVPSTTDPPLQPCRYLRRGVFPLQTLRHGSSIRRLGEPLPIGHRGRPFSLFPSPTKLCITLCIILCIILFVLSQHKKVLPTNERVGGQVSSRRR